jgi:neutral ceramidase
MEDRVFVAAVGFTDGVLRAAAAEVDITPDFGWLRTGFAVASPILALHGRLRAHVLVLDDGRGERVALIATDLHAGTRLLTERVAFLLASEHAGLGLDIRRITITATHTHSGPWRIYGNPFHDAKTADALAIDPRPRRDVAFGMAKAIALGVASAVGSLVAARVGIGAAITRDLVHNRSVEAARFNACAWTLPGMTAARALAADEAVAFVPSPVAESLDRRCAEVIQEWTGACDGATGELAIIDRRVRAVWAGRVDGTPIGALLTFAAHNAMIPATCGVGSADFFGWAARAIAARLAVDGSRPSIGFAAGSTGDSDPVPEAPGTHAWETMLAARAAWDSPLGKPGLRVLAWTRSLAMRLADAGMEAIDDARAHLVSDLPITCRFVEWRADEAPPPAELFPDNVVGSLGRPVIGWPSVRGSELGRGPFSYEGARDRVFVAGDPQSPKAELMHAEVVETHPFHLVRLGETWLVSLPGEPTTFFARLMAEAVDPTQPSRPILLGVSGDYRGYLSTPQEYVRQHYEGASTLAGRHTARWYFNWLCRSTDLQTPLKPPSVSSGIAAGWAHESVEHPLLRHQSQAERTNLDVRIEKVPDQPSMVEVTWLGRLPGNADAIRRHVLCSLRASESRGVATFEATDLDHDGILSFTHHALPSSMRWQWRVFLPKPVAAYTSIDVTVREWHGAATEHDAHAERV